jgi:hypothetical protein
VFCPETTLAQRSCLLFISLSGNRNLRTRLEDADLSRELYNLSANQQILPVYRTRNRNLRARLEDADLSRELYNLSASQQILPVYRTRKCISLHTKAATEPYAEAVESRLYLHEIYHYIF